MGGPSGCGGCGPAPSHAPRRPCESNCPEPSRSGALYDPHRSCGDRTHGCPASPPRSCRSGAPRTAPSTAPDCRTRADSGAETLYPRPLGYSRVKTAPRAAQPFVWCRGGRRSGRTDARFGRTGRCLDPARTGRWPVGAVLPDPRQTIDLWYRSRYAARSRGHRCDPLRCRNRTGQRRRCRGCKRPMGRCRQPDREWRSRGAGDSRRFRSGLDPVFRSVDPDHAARSGGSRDPDRAADHLWPEQTARLAI